MARPPNPVSIQAPAYVWAHNLPEVKTAQEFELVELVASALAAGHLAFRLGDQPYALVGVLLGQSVPGDLPVPSLAAGPLGAPLVSLLGVAVEGRVSGVPCEIGLFSETARNRRWAVSFGVEPLERWRQWLNLPPFLRVAAGGLVFTTRNNAPTVRKTLWAERREADNQWR